MQLRQSECRCSRDDRREYADQDAESAANAPPLEVDARGPDGINVRNGILEWTGRGWRLRKHSLCYRTPVQLPDTYDPEARCRLYEEFLRTSLPDPAVRPRRRPVRAGRLWRRGAGCPAVRPGRHRWG